MKTVITFGTFDLFHIGHLNLLTRAAELGDNLIVGISSDSFTFQKKGRYPIITQSEREQIIKSLRCVADTFIEDSFEKKRQYILDHSADIFVMGNDWQGKFDEFNDICTVVYLPRTPNVSTTEILTKINNINK